MQIETGVFDDNYQKNPAWPLDKGSGPRIVDHHVSFAKAFTTPPVVQLALSELDAGNTSNTRLSVNVIGVDPLGFELRFSTWADTKIYSASVNWMAIGA